MRLGVSAFQAGRLTQARILRGLRSFTALEALSGISKQNLSRYEKGQVKPTEETLETIARTLNLPTGFFLKPIVSASGSPALYRSLKASLAEQRARAEQLITIGEEALIFIENYVELPELSLPRYGSRSSITTFTAEMIEEAAAETRKRFGFPSGPLPNLVLLAENSGIATVRTYLADRELDGLSRWADRHPVVILNDSKASSRSRFDLAHELGHIVLHSYVPAEYLESRSLSTLMENQAHRYAGALLLPPAEFREDIWLGTLDEFETLKPKWQVSIQAMIRRSLDLEIIDDEQYRRLWIQIGRRGWRQLEPLENAIGVEQPNLIKQSLEAIADQLPGGVSLIEQQLPLGNLLEELASGTLSFQSASRSSNLITLRDYM